MIVLITGANGFIGSALTALLVKKGYTVHYLTTSLKKIKNTANYKGFLWKPFSNEIDLRCFDGVEVIVNLAGHSINCKWNKRNKDLIKNSRLQVSNTLFNALQQIDHRVKHIISASAIGIYPSNATINYTEDYTVETFDFLSDVCYHWEKANKRFETIGITSTITRFGLILSKDEGVLHELAKIVSLGLGACLGNGKQGMSWIHYEDVIRIIDHLIEKQIAGVFNVVASNPTSQKQFLICLAKQLRKPLIFPNIPSFLIRLILGERAVLVLSNQWISNQKIENTGYQFKYKTLEDTLKDLYNS